MNTAEEVLRRPLARPGRARPSTRTATIALCALPLVFLAVAIWRRRWVADDGFIDLRVVANLHHGLGPVYNAGERVEAYTSPLWVALMWAVSAVLSFVPLEWIAVVVGALGTLAGTAAAARGSLLLWRASGRAGVALPFGLLVLVALPPFWDFATSGLETGIAFLWLGGTFLLLAELHLRDGAQARPAGWGHLRPRLTPQAVAIAVGLGSLVRPDLALFSLAFFVALIAAPQPPRRLRSLRLAAWALALPVAYQLFRMGYFAALEPNTALAKEAGLAEWSRGWQYLKDLVGPYLLWLPFALLLGYAVYALRASPRMQRRLLILAAAPIAAALLDALYVVRVGGDFMHARMLLPAVFGLALPLAVVVPRRPRWELAFALAIVVWAVVCASHLRAPETTNHTGLVGAIADERTVYVGLAHERNPVTLHDFRRTPHAKGGWLLNRAAAHERGLIVHVPAFVPFALVINAPVSRGSQAPLVAGVASIGIIGYAAGPRVHIVDEYGLADPLASRMRAGLTMAPVSALIPVSPAKDHYNVTRGRGRPGHEKFLPTEWIVARFAPPGEHLVNVLVSPGQLAAARRALHCGQIARLLTAVTAPLTFDRFMSDIAASPSLTTLRFSALPTSAAREVCSSR